MASNMAIRMRADSGEFIYVPDQYKGKKPASSSSRRSRSADYDYDNVEETRSSRRTRASGHYEEVYEEPAPRRRAAQPRVKVIREEAEPRVVVIRERAEPEVRVIRERAPAQQQVRYADHGDGYDQDYVQVNRTRARAPRQEVVEDFDDRAEAPAARRAAPAQKKPSMRDKLIAYAEENGEGVVEAGEGVFYDVRINENGHWSVRRVDGPEEVEDEIQISSARRTRAKQRVVEEEDDASAPRSATKKAPAKQGGNSFLRSAARIASWGLVGTGALLTVGGVAGVATNGADMGSVIGRLWPNMQQAIWPIGTGIAMMGGGAVGLRVTRSKPKEA